MIFSKEIYVRFCQEKNAQRGEFNDGYDIEEINNTCNGVMEISESDTECWFQYDDFKDFVKYLRKEVLKEDIDLALKRMCTECICSDRCIEDYVSISLDDCVLSVIVTDDKVKIYADDLLCIFVIGDLSLDLIYESNELSEYAESNKYSLEGYTCMSYN